MAEDDEHLEYFPKRARNALAPWLRSALLRVSRAVVAELANRAKVQQLGPEPTMFLQAAPTYELGQPSPNRFTGLVPSLCSRQRLSRRT